MEKSDIILDMCYTYRHDYGLLNLEEAQVIYNTMKELFEKCIEKHLNLDVPDPTVEPWQPPVWTEEKKEELKKVLEEIFPKLKENANQYEPTIYGPITPKRYEWGKCPVCKGNYKNMTHYVCNNQQCPTKVTCSNSSNETLEW